MTSFRQGGKRRVDRVLDPHFLDDLSIMTMDDLRDRRRAAEQEEVDHSYVRRLLQGRIDIMRAELAWRVSGSGSDLVEHLAEVLADDNIGPSHGMGRHSPMQPSDPGAHRRRYEVLLDDVSLSDVRARTDEELRSTLQMFVDKEAVVSSQRRAIQQVMDRCSDEVGRRYRDGEAEVVTLLADEPH